MTPTIQVPLGKAQEIKKQLLALELIDNNFRPQKDGQFIYFPIKASHESLKEYTTIDKDLQPQMMKMIPSFKEALEKLLTLKELAIAKTAHDVIGNIAIIEIPPELVNKEQSIAKALLDSNPQIRTVVKKSSIHDGEYRIQQHEILVGEHTTVTEYNENNCRLALDINTVYFSPRLATERKRIYEQVTQGEDVLVMFSGAAPYCCVIGKNTTARTVVGIEINPEGHRYGLLNVQKNRLNNVELYCGDVRTVAPTLGRIFDRIIMPLPKISIEFLDVALAVSRPGTIIHLYWFSHEDAFAQAKQAVVTQAEHHGKQVEVIDIVKTTQNKPRTYRICVDIRVLC